MVKKMFSAEADGFYGCWYPDPSGPDSALILMLGDDSTDLMAVSGVKWIHKLGHSALAMSPAKKDYGHHNYPLERFGKAIEFLKSQGIKKIGIVGVGNVGRRVDRMAGSLGFKVLKNDPPRMEAEGPDGFCSLDYLLENASVVTLHVPLDETTRGMADDVFFGKMRPGTIFINASRGEVVDDEALKRAIPKLGPVIIDTWNNEPCIDRELMGMVDIATPHIAGYSYQGKQNGTAQSVRALARFFGFEPLYEFFPKTEIIDLETIKLDLKGKSQGEIASTLQYNYPIFTDDFMFRMHPEDFEKLRSNYQYRREFYVD